MFSTAFLDLPPLQSAHGVVVLPGSKSISNRVLLLAALSTGHTTLRGLLLSDDTRVMLDALRQLGVGVAEASDAVLIEGLGGRPITRQARLFMGNAGTAMRPLTAVLALLGGDFELFGVARMHERPIGDLVVALRQLGCRIDYLGQSGFPPLRIGQPTLQLGAPIRVRGDVSSQFLSALLMALPLVAQQEVVIAVEGELISKPYIEITLQLLARFGIAVQRQGWGRFTLPAGSQYQSPGTWQVEADASSASYFVALGAIASDGALGQKIRIEGVGSDSIQGDIAFVAAARQMGAHITSGPHWLEVRRGRWPLQGLELDCNHMPDAAMTLAVMALYAHNSTTLRNIASWQVKETNRLQAMACELRKLGATVASGDDFITISPPASDWRAAHIQTYDDHRIAMCFSLAAFNPAQLPVRIDNPACVAKTYPDYFETLFAVAQTAAAAIPVICIDGPSASGKGTLAAALAARLGYHLLDSGALYRLTALAAQQAGLALSAEPALAELARGLDIRFEGERVWLGGTEVSQAIRSEEVSKGASLVAALPQVRQALLALQRGFRRLPGLVADGRDMGTVVFSDAPLKIFLTASALERAKRRQQQLLAQGVCVTLDTLCAELQARDARDTTRPIAPLRSAQDAQLLDNSDLTVQAAVTLVLRWWQSKQVFQQVFETAAKA